VTVYVALLRGINVGGHNKLPMATLRATATGCGFGDVQTYIQSGNVVFTSRLGAVKAASTLHDAILAESGVDSRVVLRTAADLDAVVAKNPFLARGADEKLVHVSFMYPESTPTLAAVDAQIYAPDEVEVIGAHAYLHTPDGMGRSKLANESMMRKLGIQGTARNWRTVTTLAEMATAMS
jgi:Uncharacterized protein conserved in bacteria